MTCGRQNIRCRTETPLLLDGQLGRFVQVGQLVDQFSATAGYKGGPNPTSSKHCFTQSTVGCLLAEANLEFFYDTVSPVAELTAAAGIITLEIGDPPLPLPPTVP